MNGQGWLELMEQENTQVLTRMRSAVDAVSNDPCAPKHKVIFGPLVDGFERMFMLFQHQTKWLDDMKGQVGLLTAAIPAPKIDPNKDVPIDPTIKQILYVMATRSPLAVALVVVAYLAYNFATRAYLIQ